MSFLQKLQELGLWGQQPGQPQQQNPYGLNPQQMRQAAWQSVGNLGSQIMALSQQMTPAQRAAMMSRADFTGGFQQNLYNQAQMKLLQDKQRQAAEEDERTKAAKAYVAQTLQGMPDGPERRKAMAYLQLNDLPKAIETLYAQTEPKDPLMKTIREGDKDVTYQLDRSTGRWIKFAEGAAFKPTPDTVVNNNIGGANKFDENLQTGLGQMYGELAKEGTSAAATKGAVQQLRGLLQQNGGALDGFATVVAPYFPEDALPEGANDLVAADAIISGLIPKQRVPGSGSTSDYDARMFAKSLPSVWNKPGANTLILDTLEAYSDYKIAVADIIGSVAADPTITNKQMAIRDAVKQLPDPFANWKKLRGNFAGGATAQQPASGKGDAMSEELENALKEY